MIDTIACLVTPSRPLGDEGFGGGLVASDFDDSLSVKARLWLNPQTHYAPRVTYWRAASLDPFTGELVMTDDQGNGLLKMEFSVPKLAEVAWHENVTEVDVEVALTRATEFIRRHFGDDLPDVREWRCQRVDYAWQWDVQDDLPAYMSVMHKLHVRTYERHPFDASEGVVWKSRGRWVKFYNKSKEQGYKSGTVLRFEVSNYKEAARRMASSWFACPRIVREMVRFPRAVYVMARMFDALGLRHDQEYGHEERLVYRLRDVYGVKNLPRASHALRMIHEYGHAAFSDDLALIARSTYYHWRARLLADGFLAITQPVVSTETEVVQNEEDDRKPDLARPVASPLPALTLPLALAVGAGNLASLRNARPEGEEKIFWKNQVAPKFLLSDSAPESAYIMREVAS